MPESVDFKCISYHAFDENFQNIVQNNTSGDKIMLNTIENLERYSRLRKRNSNEIVIFQYDDINKVLELLKTSYFSLQDAESFNDRSISKILKQIYNIICDDNIVIGLTNLTLDQINYLVLDRKEILELNKPVYIFLDKESANNLLKNQFSCYYFTSWINL